MSRKLVAALACRASGSRLYGKPLQNLENEHTILDHLIEDIKNVAQIEEIVLGISEGDENRVFIDVAKKHNISYMIGSERNVLFRLVACGRLAKVSDIFRVRVRT